MIKLSNKISKNLNDRMKRRINLTNTLSLQHFIIRGQVLKSYRNLMKVAWKIPDEKQKRDVVTQVRIEYKKFKDLKDTGVVKQLLREATKQVSRIDSLYNDNARIPTATNVTQPEKPVGEGWPWEKSS
jgi:myo-inositol-1-phosphate synthase